MDRATKIAYTAIAVISITVVSLIYSIGWHMEAAAFNKFSNKDKKATWLDAASIELRVEACK